MAVFKDENGVWKPGGYAYGWISPPVVPGRIVSSRGISMYPPFLPICRRPISKFADARIVRAAEASSNDSIRKGGASERNS